MFQIFQHIDAWDKAYMKLNIYLFSFYNLHGALWLPDATKIAPKKWPLHWSNTKIVHHKIKKINIIIP